MSMNKAKPQEAIDRTEIGDHVECEAGEVEVKPNKSGKGTHQMFHYKRLADESEGKMLVDDRLWWTIEYFDIDEGDPVTLVCTGYNGRYPEFVVFPSNMKGGE